MIAILLLARRRPAARADQAGVRVPGPAREDELHALLRAGLRRLHPLREWEADAEVSRALIAESLRGAPPLRPKDLVRLKKMARGYVPLLRAGRLV